MGRELSHDSVDQLIATYADAAITHHDELLRLGEPASAVLKANQAAGTIADIFRELRTRKPDATAALLPLLGHPNVGVRSWAGAHALTFNPDLAVPVLEAIEQHRGPVGFTAQMTLRTWREGTLRFP